MKKLKKRTKRPNQTKKRGAKAVIDHLIRHPYKDGQGYVRAEEALKRSSERKAEAVKKELARKEAKRLKELEDEKKSNP